MRLVSYRCFPDKYLSSRCHFGSGRPQEILSIPAGKTLRRLSAVLLDYTNTPCYSGNASRSFSSSHLIKSRWGIDDDAS